MKVSGLCMYIRNIVDDPGCAHVGVTERHNATVRKDELVAFCQSITSIYMKDEKASPPR